MLFSGGLFALFLIIEIFTIFVGTCKMSLEVKTRPLAGCTLRFICDRWFSSQWHVVPIVQVSDGERWGSCSRPTFSGASDVGPWSFLSACTGDLHDVLAHKEGRAQCDKLVCILAWGPNLGQVFLPREILMFKSIIPLQDESFTCMQGWISLHEMSKLEPELHDGGDASGMSIDVLVEVWIIQENNNGVIPAVSVSNNVLQYNIGNILAAGEPVHLTYPVMVPRAMFAESHDEIMVYLN